MAFTIEGYFDKKRKDDERYVRFYVNIYGKRNGKTFSQIVPHHKCSSAELAAFSPIAPEDQIKFEQVITDKDRGFYCIDWENEDLKLQGSWTQSDYQTIDFIFVPCNFIDPSNDFYEENISPNCIRNLEA